MVRKIKGRLVNIDEIEQAYQNEGYETGITTVVIFNSGREIHFENLSLEDFYRYI